jgi:hypothetical protein
MPVLDWLDSEQRPTRDANILVGHLGAVSNDPGGCLKYCQLSQTDAVRSAQVFLLRLVFARLRMGSKKRANIRSSPTASYKIDVLFCRRTRQYCLRTEFARLMQRTLTSKRTARQPPVQNENLLNSIKG